MKFRPKVRWSISGTAARWDVAITVVREAVERVTAQWDWALADKKSADPRTPTAGLREDTNLRTTYQMTTKGERRKIGACYIAPVVTDSIVGDGGVVLRRPVSPLLVGVVIDPSVSVDDDVSFYVEIFRQPLYVLADGIRLNFSRRLGGKSWTAPRDVVLQGGFAELRRALSADGLPRVGRVADP
jgi:hypothetical protein